MILFIVNTQWFVFLTLLKFYTILHIFCSQICGLNLSNPNKHRKLIVYHLNTHIVQSENCLVNTIQWIGHFWIRLYPLRWKELLSSNLLKWIEKIDQQKPPITFVSWKPFETIRTPIRCGFSFFLIKIYFSISRTFLEQFFVRGFLLKKLKFFSNFKIIFPFVGICMKPALITVVH